MGSMMIKLCGSGCLIYLSTSHEFHDGQGLLWQCGKLTDLQQITKNKLGSWRYILQLLPVGQASVMAMKFQFQFTECLHVLQLVACPTKTENYLALCILLLAAPMECHVPSFQQLSQDTCSFFKRYAVSSKRPKKKTHLEGKLLLSCLQKKTQQKNRTESAFFFLLYYL
jgi:hypothetical protein